MSSSRSVTRSTCQAWFGATTRQAPNAPLSSNAAPLTARAIFRAGCFGSPAIARSMSSVSRPSSLSRTAPPTSHASSPGERVARRP